MITKESKDWIDLQNEVNLILNDTRQNPPKIRRIK